MNIYQKISTNKTTGRYECGFDTTDFGDATAWDQIIAALRVKYTRELDDESPHLGGAFLWQSTESDGGLHIVTRFNPLTGESPAPYPDKAIRLGLAGYMGVSSFTEQAIVAFISLVELRAHLLKGISPRMDYIG